MADIPPHGQDQPPGTHERSASLRGTARIADQANLEVIRGVNSNRVTLLGVLVGIALTVAFGVESLGWPVRVLVGVLAFLGLSIVLHVVFSSQRATHEVMRFAHWVLGGRA